jgi:beta-phosphoglucomutase
LKICEIMPKRFRAICFDLDGVLVHTMPLHARAWQEACRARGLRVSKRDIYAWEGESGTVTARTILRRRRRPVTAAAIAELLRDKERRFAGLARRIRVEPRLARLLGRLAARGIRLSLVTGTSAGEVRRIVPRRVLAAFAAVVTGDRVRRGKPHPEPYRTAMRRLGVPPRETVVVENAPYGIRSARRAGVGLVIALASSLPRGFLREAHVVVGSAARLESALERVFDNVRSGSIQ